MKKLICTLLTILVIGDIRAQQDAMFTHYMYNTLWLNPAYAGTREAMTITGIHRSQWTGFDGAPMDQSITMHSPIMGGKMGLGLSFLNDKIGPAKSNTAAFDFAYHVKLTAKSKLGFGLKGLLNIYSNSLNTLTLAQTNDVAFAENVRSVLPNAGTGIYYYRERFYAGVSTPKLLENKLSKGAVAASKEQRHYFVIMGAVFNLTPSVKLKPTAFIKATMGAPVSADLTASFLLKDKFSVGAMYRTGDGAGILIGYDISQAFGLGYSFDWSLANTTGKYNSGSHEIMLRYDLYCKGKSRITSPRYF